MGGGGRGGETKREDGEERVGRMGGGGQGGHKRGRQDAEREQERNVKREREGKISPCVV